MAIVTWSGKVHENSKVAPRKIVEKDIDDGVKHSAHIRIVIDKEVSKEDKVDIGDK